MFICNHCGEEYAKFQGRCDNCQEWNTLVAFQVAKSLKKKTKSSSDSKEIKVVHNQDIEEKELENFSIQINLKELQNIFPSGFVRGASYLLSGEPGIGKSTLLLLLASSVSGKILYISGEETTSQIKKRIERLRKTNTSTDNSSFKNLYLTNNVDVDVLSKEISVGKYDLIFIDSIQTLYTSEVDNFIGTLNQMKIACQQLIQICKSKNTILFLVGHINKAGDIAGPKILEHMVDATLLMYLEKNIIEGVDIRVIKPLKNRFASVDTSALFHMTEGGLTPLSKEILANYYSDLANDNPIGTCYFPHFVGKKLIFSEVEALVVQTELSIPKRITEGIQQNRLHRILAIMEKYCGLSFKNLDVYINVSGGIRGDDITMDLSLVACIYSSLKRIPIPKKYLFVGELGLSGKIKNGKTLMDKKKAIDTFEKFIYHTHLSKSQKIEDVVILDNVVSCLKVIDALK